MIQLWVFVPLVLIPPVFLQLSSKRVVCKGSHTTYPLKEYDFCSHITILTFVTFISNSEEKKCVNQTQIKK